MNAEYGFKWLKNMLLDIVCFCFNVYMHSQGSKSRGPWAIGPRIFQMTPWFLEHSTLKKSSFELCIYYRVHKNTLKYS